LFADPATHQYGNWLCDRTADVYNDAVRKFGAS